MFRNMANSVIAQEQITTTVAKAKEIRRVVDRLVTLGKTGRPDARRLAFDRTRDKLVVGKLFGPLAERYKGRNGGYTRVLKVSDRRRGDAAEMAILELVDRPELRRTKEQLKKAAEARAGKAGDKKAAKKDAAPVEADPFKGMKKLFGGSRKKAREAGKAAPAAKKADSGEKAAKKKAPAKKKAAKKAD